MIDEIENRLKELLNQKADELNVGIKALEVMSDHVHLFVESDPTEPPQRLVKQFKGFTSHELREEFPELTTRLPSLWSRSYYAGTVGHVSDKTVKSYIESQKGV